MRLRPIGFSVIAATLLVACIEPLPVPTGRFGFITVETFGPDDPNYTVAPAATFFGQTNAALSVFAPGTCQVGDYSDFPQNGGRFTTLYAGDALDLSVSGQVRQMVPDTSGSFISYRYGAAAALDFTPGDTLSIVVPGDASGFPAMDIAVRTAEPFSHSDVPFTPDVSENIDITWDAAPEPGALMSFSLAYPNEFAFGNIRNEHVLCAFEDDGTGTIPAHYLTGWRTVVSDTARRVKATRLRYSTDTVDSRTTVAILSLFTRPLRAYVAP